VTCNYIDRTVWFITLVTYFRFNMSVRPSVSEFDRIKESCNIQTSFWNFSKYSDTLIFQNISTRLFFKIFWHTYFSKYFDTLIFQNILTHLFFKIFWHTYFSKYPDTLIFQNILTHVFFKIFRHTYFSKYSDTLIFQNILTHLFFKIFWHTYSDPLHFLTARL
jgi:hypothetical protein